MKYKNKKLQVKKEPSYIESTVPSLTIFLYTEIFKSKTVQ